MKERAILFSGPMVRAILDGRKTVTRRVMRTNHVGYSAFYRWDGEPFRRAMMRCLNETKPGSSVFCESNRFGVPGDRLWVRETWCYAHPDYHDEAEGRRKGDRPVREYPAPWWCHYAATDDVDEPKWRPSILMPRWASRITLEIVDVRVERLHEIDEADAEREGAKPADDVANGDATQAKHLLYAVHEQIADLVFEGRAFFKCSDREADAAIVKLFAEQGTDDVSAVARAIHAWLKANFELEPETVCDGWEALPIELVNGKWRHGERDQSDSREHDAVITYATEPSPETGHVGWCWWALGKMGDAKTLHEAMRAAEAAVAVASRAAQEVAAP